MRMRDSAASAVFDIGMTAFDRARHVEPLNTKIVRHHNGVSVLLDDGSAQQASQDLEARANEMVALLIWRTSISLDAAVADEALRGARGPGAFAIIPASNPSWWALRDQATDDNLHIQLERSLIAEICLRDGMEHVPSFDSMIGFAHPLIAQLGEYAIELLDREQPPSRLAWDALITVLVLALARIANERGEPMPRTIVRKGGLAGWQIRRTTEYIHERLNETIALNELAAIAGLSPFHFARAFKQSVGDPPHRYQIRRRLEKACEMLVETDLPVIEIATAVGYETPQTLSRLFRREFGISPSFYRRESSR